MRITQAVILAAGEGNRMRPLTYARPKVMLPLANRPILEKLVTEIAMSGITEFIFIVGYHDEEIRNYFDKGKKWNINITYVNQQKQTGTANAIGMVRGLVTGSFIVANGDVIVDKSQISNIKTTTQNYNSIVKTDLINDENNLCTTLTVIKRDKIDGLGAIEVEGSKVIKIHEKSASPPSNLANAGIYLFSPDIFEAIEKTPLSPRGEYEITDSIQLLIDAGHPVCYKEIDRWFDLSYPWDLLSANEIEMQNIKHNIKGKVENNATITGIVNIGENSIVRAGSYIIGPVIIGENCDIGPNSYIRPYTSIDDECHVGAAVEVKNSIVMSGTKIPHLSYVGDSIIGRNCNFGAGTKIANLRLDKQTVFVGNINTGRRKLGAIIGDNVQTGINACINAGCTIGDGTFIGPGAIAHGIIAPASRIF